MQGRKQSQQNKQTFERIFKLKIEVERNYVPKLGYLVWCGVFYQFLANIIF